MLSAAFIAVLSAAGLHAEENRMGLTVTVPNGYANISVDDLSVQSIGGAVRWTRNWDGQEWKFNHHWESLSQSWKNLTGSQTADTTGSAVSASGATSGSTTMNSSGSSDDGCWVWVDEDWAPSEGTSVIGGVPQAGPMMPERTTPFNRLMGESSTDYAPAVRVSVDYASLCVGVLQNTAVRDLEAIRRENELYLGDQGRYAFSNRAILEKRAVQMLPTAAAAALQSQLASGTFTATPVTNEKGYRWIHKEGDWIDYNTQGQVVAYGDKNDNVVWLVRDTTGKVYGVVDANGRVLYALDYTNALLTEVRDYPIPGNSLDLPARSVKYQYDSNNRLTSVTDARGYITRYDYDGQNHIVKVTDQEGRMEQLDYSGDEVVKRTAPDGSVTDYIFDYDDSNKQYASTIKGPATSAGRRTEDYTHNKVGKLVRRIVNGRIEEEVRYDTGARAELHTNARGFTSKITYNEFEQVIQEDQADGTIVKHNYSALHLQPIEDTDELGVKTRYEYDSKGNLLKKIEAAGTPEERITEYENNSLGQAIKTIRKGRTEANGTGTPDAVWQTEYDGQGQVKKTTDPEGNIRQYVYNRIGSLVSYTDPLNRVIQYEVDPSGHLIKMTDAHSRTKSYAYDKVGNAINYTDARGKSIQAAYDALNRTVQHTNAVGGAYKLQYNAQGLPVAQTDADNRTRQTEFDAFLQLTKQIDALGNITEYAYTIPDGTDVGTLGSLYQPTEIRYPTYTQQQRYDQLERPTTQTLLNPTIDGIESLVSSNAYDKHGRIKNETDANGKMRFHAYNNFGQVIETTDSLGNKTTALYDARGNLIQIKDANGNAYRFDFDRNNRVTKEVLPLGQTTTYQYDAVGNLRQRVDGKGNKATYEYDAANRLIRREIMDAGASVAVLICTYHYDDNDNLTFWSEGGLSATLTYDDANRKLSETVNYGNSTTLEYRYTYTAAGYKKTLTYPDNTVVTYDYAGHGELSSIEIPNEGTLSVNEWKWLTPKQITLPGGTAQQFGRDGLLKLTSLGVRTPNQRTVFTLNNAYGKAQEIKTRTLDGAAYSFTYDDELRLTQVSGASNESYTLDAVSNRLTQNGSDTWQYDANNRLTAQGNTNYQYDESGNLIRKIVGSSGATNSITQYKYDGLNRLVEVQDGSGATIATYAYDPNDRRVLKDLGGVRTYFLYSDEGLLAEANSTGNIITQYGWRPNGTWGTDPIFIKTTIGNGATASVGYAYFHNDHLGTPLRATNKNGDIIWSATYTAFGEATLSNDNQLLSNLRLPGQYWDEETRLLYNYRRYYDSTLGRYDEPDPIGLKGGINTYAYVAGNPISSSDPLGLDPYGTQSCSYYTDRCRSNGGLYYCVIAPKVCAATPDGKWSRCVRQCLQDTDRMYCDSKENNFCGGSDVTCVVNIHQMCWEECINNDGSVPPSAR